MAIITNVFLISCIWTIAFGQEQSDHMYNAIFKLQKQVQQMQRVYKEENQQKDNQILKLTAEIEQLKEVKAETAHLKELKAEIEHLKENLAKHEAECRYNSDMFACIIIESHNYCKPFCFCVSFNLRIPHHKNGIKIF